MISWDIVLGLMAMCFALPFLFLYGVVARLRERARQKNNETALLRAQLKEMEEHVQRDQSLFLEALGVPFLLMRPSGRVVMANKEACQLFGFKSLANANLLRILPNTELRRVLQRAAESTDEVHATIQVPRPEGTRFYRTTATHLATKEQHIGIVLLDMTEEHRAQIIRRDFVANASHELRTPLTLILGYLETLLDSPDDADMRQHSLEIMKRHADRMARLVADMLMLSRVEAPDTSYLKQEEFDLVQLTTEVQQRLESVIETQKATVEIDISPRPFNLMGDSFYWSQVLFNLMENALKNTPSPGLRLQVQASIQENGTRRICVTDNGTGIAPEALPFIFNRFYRANTSGKIKGTGLGLAIVKHAVEAHGGSIFAESVPGKRTAFTITLPPTGARQTHTGKNSR